MKMHWLPYTSSVLLALITLVFTWQTINQHYISSYDSTSTMSLHSQDDSVTGKKVIYLTFDDGPSIHTPKLLEILDRYNVKATFFVVGNNGSSSIIKEAYDKGHTIGLHTYSHQYKKIYASKEAYLADLEAIQDVVVKATGNRTYIMRFPGGSSNSISTPIKKGIMTELTQTVTAEGYQYFDWNVDSNDGLGKLTRKEIANNVIAGIKKHNSSIVLQHDIWPESIYAVEDIIKWGLANGYSFAPLTMDSFAAHHTISN